MHTTMGWTCAECQREADERDRRHQFYAWEARTLLVVGAVIVGGFALLMLLGLLAICLTVPPPTVR
jgi:hypothetical protein